jgi:hypothetical protein
MVFGQQWHKRINLFPEKDFGQRYGENLNCTTLPN